MKKLCCLVLSMLMVVVSCSMCIFAQSDSENDNLERVERSQYNIEDNFSNDIVLVVITNAASLKCRTYGVDDFCDIGCISVEDLTQHTRSKVVQQMSQNSDNISGKIDLDNYHQMLSLKLTIPGKENVLQAIEKLHEREDVLFAQPNFEIYHEDAVTSTSVTPNDNLYSSLWAINKIQLPQAWTIQSTAPIIIGVVDGGIDGTHPDLQGVLSPTLHMDFTGDTTP